MFSRAFRVNKVWTDGDAGMLQVMNEGERVTPGPQLVVDGDGGRIVTVRGGRGIYNENKERLPGSILIIDPPDFDIESLVGELLMPTGG